MSSFYTQGNNNTGNRDTGNFTSDSDSNRSVIIKTSHSENADNNNHSRDTSDFQLDDLDDDTNSIIYHDPTNTIPNASNTSTSDNNSNRLAVFDTRASLGRHSNASKNSDLSTTGYSLYTAQESIDQPEDDEHVGNRTNDTNTNTHRDDTSVDNNTMSTDGYSVDIDDEDDDDDNEEDIDIDLAALKSFTSNDEDDQIEPVENYNAESQQDNNNSNNNNRNLNSQDNSNNNINYNFLSVPSSSGIPIADHANNISRFPTRASAISGISEISNLTKATTTADNNRNRDYSLGGVSSNLTRGITNITTTAGSSSIGDLITNSNDLETSNTNTNNVNIIEVHRLNDNLPSVKPVVDYQDKLWSTLDILDDVRDVSKFKFFDNDYYLKLSTLKKSQIKLLNDLVDVNKEYMKFDEYYEKWNKNKTQNGLSYNNMENNNMEKNNEVNSKNENGINTDMNTRNTNLDNTNSGIESDTTNNNSNDTDETNNQNNSSTPDFIEGENLFDNKIFNQLSVNMNELIINDLQEIKKNISTIDGHSRNLWQQIQ
ncbi:hypothetical protein B5S28_g1800 [[Candida] boidinii]|nr:hypothetical protein B5S28_g1800 [[Candida] boidinii]OWB60630.1 hypothetical protein B5S29_g1508 [[Candida] boidinii]